MKALAIHVLGFVALNLLMPSSVAEAGWIILALWYGAFAAVDLIALMFCYDKWLAAVLSLSAAWSGALMVEVAFLSDVMQSNDWIAQIVLTALLAVAAVRMMFLHTTKGVHHGAP